MKEPKTLKFSPNLVPLVLSGQKNNTWRLFDDKNLQKGDVVILIKRPELTAFAQAKIISVVEKKMGSLTNEDKEGHESFASNKQMYETYSKYYDREVNEDTLIKIVKFKLI